MPSYSFEASGRFESTTGKWELTLTVTIERKEKCPACGSTDFELIQTELVHDDLKGGWAKVSKEITSLFIKHGLASDDKVLRFTWKDNPYELSSTITQVQMLFGEISFD